MNAKMVMKWCRLFESEFQIDQTRVVLDFCLHCIVSSVGFSKFQWETFYKRQKRWRRKKKLFNICISMYIQKLRWQKSWMTRIQQWSRVDLIEHFKKDCIKKSFLYLFSSFEIHFYLWKDVISMDLMWMKRDDKIIALQCDYSAFFSLLHLTRYWKHMCEHSGNPSSFKSCSDHRINTIHRKTIIITERTSFHFFVVVATFDSFIRPFCNLQINRFSWMSWTCITFIPFQIVLKWIHFDSFDSRCWSREKEMTNKNEAANRMKRKKNMVRLTKNCWYARFCTVIMCRFCNHSWNTLFIFFSSLHPVSFFNGHPVLNHFKCQQKCT